MLLMLLMHTNWFFIGVDLSASLANFQFRRDFVCLHRCWSVALFSVVFPLVRQGFIYLHWLSTNPPLQRDFICLHWRRPAHLFGVNFPLRWDFICLHWRRLACLFGIGFSSSLARFYLASLASTHLPLRHQISVCAFIGINPLASSVSSFHLFYEIMSDFIGIDEFFLSTSKKYSRWAQPLNEREDSRWAQPLNGWWRLSMSSSSRRAMKILDELSLWTSDNTLDELNPSISNNPGRSLTKECDLKRSDRWNLIKTWIKIKLRAKSKRDLGEKCCTRVVG